MISDISVKAVQAAADVLEVVEDYVPLKKQGQNWWACCPFHDEKSPSFSVAPQKGIYKCFGCGKAGDAVSFIMEIEGATFPEAIRILARKYQIDLQESELTEEAKDAQQYRESLLIVLNYAKDFYRKQLWETRPGKAIGLGYFRERGFHDDTLEAFDLGYSSDSWNDFEQQALGQGYQLPLLVETGMVIEKEDGKRYDRFRGRVMFPIHNLTGRVVAFGARTLKKDDKPKYLNSPETEVYHKSQALYGVFQAKSAIRSEDACLLVEGYTDVLSLHQAGIKNVVASSGTSLTEGQIQLIKRFTNQLTILYDGDPAGVKASLRGIDLVLEKGLDVRVVLLPEGEDPDSYVRKLGGEAFRAFLKEHSRDFILFKTELQLGESGDDPSRRASVIRDIVQSIIKVPDRIKRELFYQQSAKLLGIQEEVLMTEGSKLLIAQQEKARKQQQRQAARQQETQAAEAQLPTLEELADQMIPVAPQRHARYYQEREFVRILVSYGFEKVGDSRGLWEFLFEELKEIELETPIFQEISQIYRSLVAQGELPDERMMIQQLTGQAKEAVINMVTERYQISDHWARFEIVVPAKDAFLGDLVRTNILRIKYRHLEKLCREVLEELQEAQDLDEVMAGQQLYLALKKEKSELAKMLGIVIN